MTPSHEQSASPRIAFWVECSVEIDAKRWTTDFLYFFDSGYKAYSNIYSQTLIRRIFHSDPNNYLKGLYQAERLRRANAKYQITPSNPQIPSAR